MKHILAALCLFAAAPAFAQSGTNIPAGQTPGGIRLDGFTNNTDAVGFRETALNPAVVATGTTQATAALLITRTNVITSCPGGTGVLLPSIQQYVPIVVINRSGASCLVYPTLGATVETAPGTNGAVNAAATIAINANMIFRPISPTYWVQ